MVHTVARGLRHHLCVDRVGDVEFPAIGGLVVGEHQLHHGASAGREAIVSCRDRMKSLNRGSKLVAG